MSGLGFRILGFGLKVSDLGFALGFRVWAERVRRRA